MIRFLVHTWIATCVTGILVVAAFFRITERHLDNAEVLQITLAALGIALIVAIPIILGLGFLLHYLKQKLLPANTSKMICTLYAPVAFTLLILVTAAIIQWSLLDDIGSYVFLGSLPFMGSFIACIWLFRWPIHPAGSSLGESTTLSSNTAILLPDPITKNGYYTILTLAILKLLYGLYSFFLPTLQYTLLLRMVMYGLIDFFLPIAGIILFTRRNAWGWKLLAICFSYDFCAIVMGISKTYRYLGEGMGASGMLTYLISMALLLSANLAGIILLLMPKIRVLFKIDQTQAWIWISIGGGVGLAVSDLLRLINLN